MGYDELIYRIGKLYGRLREQRPAEEYPSFSGQIADLLDENAVKELPLLQGEYVIAYSDGKGADHFIRVYFDDGAFEAEGTPGTPFFSMSVSAD